MAWRSHPGEIMCACRNYIGLSNAVAGSCMSQLFAANQWVQRHGCWYSKPACIDQLKLCSVSQVQPNMTASSRAIATITTLKTQS